MKGNLTMNPMLSKALREFTTGLLNQLLVNLSGTESQIWWNEFTKFMRKEPCWQTTSVIVAKPIELVIDRTLHFDIHSIHVIRDNAWTVGHEDVDQRSQTVLVMEEVQLDKMPCNTFGNVTEVYLPFDARIYKMIWYNRKLIPPAWRGMVLIFKGTTLKHPDERLDMYLKLYWDDGDREWNQGLQCFQA